MNNTTRTRLSAIALAATLVWTPSPTPEADPAQQGVVDWAASRYTAAGLVLPAVDIYFHSQGSGTCPGTFVAYWTSGHDTDRIDMCTTNRRVLLHELAHAWVHRNLTIEDREQFLQLWDLTTWASPDVAHHQQGIEEAAEIIAWGLLDGLDTISHLYHYDSQRLAVAYQHLTGSPSPYRTNDETAAPLVSPLPAVNNDTAPAPAMIPLRPAK